MVKLTIFIQCHNRPAFARCAIESALRQTNRDFRLVISDSSSNDELCNLILAEFPNLEYRRRRPTLSASDHFNINISEADTDFVCLFHDDDLMETSYVDEMLKTIELHPHAVAYSCNAEIIDDDGASKGSSFQSAHDDLVIETPRALAGRYFARFPTGIAPLPAYIFPVSIIKNIPVDSQAGGKYSDVAWLLEISKFGSIVWNSEKLIRYRIHATNDSGIESIKDRLKLLGYFKLNISSVGMDIISDYRFFLYKRIFGGWLPGRKFPGKYTRIFNSYLLIYRIKRFLKFETYVYFFYKLKELLARQR